MERSQENILGIDIGGTKIRAIFGRKFFEFATPKSKREFLAIIAKLPKAERVGVSVAGVVHGTRVKISPNIKYLKNFDFKSLKLGHIKVINDARAFLLAEAGNAKHVFGLTIGTGIGRAASENKSKHLESQETWEREYQKTRDKKDYNKLAEYLAEKINPLVKKYKAKKIILGGGVMDKKGFYKQFSKKLLVSSARARFGRKSGAMGAAMLWR